MIGARSRRLPPQPLLIENHDPPPLRPDRPQLAQRLQRLRRRLARGAGPGGELLLGDRLGADGLDALAERAPGALGLGERDVNLRLGG